MGLMNRVGVTSCVMDVSESRHSGKRMRDGGQCFEIHQHREIMARVVIGIRYI